MTDIEVASKVGKVTGRIAPGTVGEVMIPIRGGRETFHAYAFDAGEVFEVGDDVIVVEAVGPRSVKVVRYPSEEGAAAPWDQG